MSDYGVTYPYEVWTNYCGNDRLVVLHAAHPKHARRRFNEEYRRSKGERVVSVSKVK